MALRVYKVEQPVGEPMVRVTERVWVNADHTKVVPEGDPEAAFLLAAEDDEIPAGLAKSLGLRPGRAPEEDVPLEQRPGEPHEADKVPPEVRDPGRVAAQEDPPEEPQEVGQPKASDLPDQDTAGDGGEKQQDPAPNKQRRGGGTKET